MNFNIAVILPYDSRYVINVWKVKPFLQAAVKYLKRKEITYGFDLKFRYSDSQCSVVNGPIEAYKAYRQGLASLFLGPFCDFPLSPIARYNHLAWKVPIVTSGGLSHTFTKEKMVQYSTLTRMVCSFQPLNYYLVDILSRFGWRKVYIIYTREDGVTQGHVMSHLYFLMASAITEAATKVLGKKAKFHLYDNSVMDEGRMLKEKVGTSKGGENFILLS